MSDFFLILINTALINNLALSHLVGIDLQTASSRHMQAAWFTGIVTFSFIVFCIPLAWLVDTTLLKPFELQHFDVLIYVLIAIVVITLFTQINWKLFPLLSDKYNALAPLLLMNSLLVAVMLLQQSFEQGFFIIILKAIGYGLGFVLSLLVITTLRDRIDQTRVPVAFQNIPILFISLGLFSMGLMGLSGLQ